MNWRCYLGRHQWGAWTVELFMQGPKRRYYRQCGRCGRREWK